MKSNHEEWVSFRRASKLFFSSEYLHINYIGKDG